MTQGRSYVTSDRRTGGRSPGTYFFLVCLLSLPFWFLGAGSLGLPMNLPLGSLQVLCPAVAALVLTHHREGADGVSRMLRRTLDPRGARKVWFAPALLLMPTIVVLSYLVMRLSGRSLPKWDVPIAMLPACFAAFFVAAAIEELGWTGYVLAPLQDRFGALRAALILGGFWGLWHVVGWYVQAGHSLRWTIAKVLLNIPTRVLIVWVHNNAGRGAVTAILIHDTMNVGELLFPRYGSHYDPVVSAAITTLVAVLVVCCWEGGTLASLRWRGRPRGAAVPSARCDLPATTRSSAHRSAGRAACRGSRPTTPARPHHRRGERQRDGRQS